MPAFWVMSVKWMGAVAALFPGVANGRVAARSAARANVRRGSIDNICYWVRSHAGSVAKTAMLSGRVPAQSARPIPLPSVGGSFAYAPVSEALAGDFCGGASLRMTVLMAG